MFGWLTASVALFEPLRLEGKVSKSVDVCVYGGTSAGVIAAYAARQSGKSVLLIEPGRHLGGMSSGGLGYTDIGNKYVVRGLASISIVVWAGITASSSNEFSNLRRQRRFSTSISRERESRFGTRAGS